MGFSVLTSGTRRRSVKYYFLPEDLLALRKKIEEMTEKVNEALGNIGTSCQGGSDTFHDNFEHEQGQRLSAMWSGRARELNAVLSNAEVISVEFLAKDMVTIGKNVTILDETTGVTKTFKVGSYMNFREDSDDDSNVSYAAPLANMVMMAKVGEVREGQIGSEKKRFKIIDIK